MILSIVIFTLVPSAFAQNLGDRNLRQGMKGTDVVSLQQILNRLGFWSGITDGVFGPKTKEAVLRFQKAKGITADGIIGPISINLLKGNSTSYRGSTGRYSERDIELLARLVHAEARGESYIGQVAVAATVLNRLKDPNYPKSIPSIIYQVVENRYQYSPVLDGQINIPANETARKAARDAIAGLDPTGGATTFYNPQKTDDQWVKTRTYHTTIGNHVFAK